MEDIDKIVLYQRNYFKTMKTQDYNFRKHQLEMLYQKIKHYQKEIEQALYSDLKKPAFEAYSTEIGFVLNSIRFIQKNLKNGLNHIKNYHHIIYLDHMILLLIDL